MTLCKTKCSYINRKTIWIQSIPTRKLFLPSPMSSPLNEKLNRPMAATSMTPSSKDGTLPTSAFSEPSEPSELAPGNNSKDQVARPQEENPQVVLVKDHSHQDTQLKEGAASKKVVKSKL
ncbi:hypothetical protein GGU10DRAFT_380189 [Lentinula aff. detonsa]|uniref:Uncharacterized protein n=1 Tax=Lentinula aff. detonsa TaxID=2804958 RepID=A0AA38KBZ1_9AGAR|nr:hypothetical protein GGU10DRAFT_380189 [Lentinula aff. detonsa]